MRKTFRKADFNGLANSICEDTEKIQIFFNNAEKSYCYYADDIFFFKKVNRGSGRRAEVWGYICNFKRLKRGFSLQEIHCLRRLARELAYASVLVGVDS